MSLFVFTIYRGFSACGTDYRFRIDRFVIAYSVAAVLADKASHALCVNVKHVLALSAVLAAAAALADSVAAFVFFFVLILIVVLAVLPVAVVIVVREVKIAVVGENVFFKFTQILIKLVNVV